MVQDTIINYSSETARAAGSELLSRLSDDFEKAIAIIRDLIGRSGLALTDPSRWFGFGNMGQRHCNYLQGLDSEQQHPTAALLSQ